MDVPIKVNGRNLTIIETIYFDYEPSPQDLMLAEETLSTLMGRTVEEIFSGKIELNYV